MIQQKVFEMMNAAKKRIIKAMQERGVKKVDLVMTWEEWAKKYGLDPSDGPGGDYYSYRYQEAPQVIFFNDNGVGCELSALSVKLVDDSFNPRFEIKCYNNEKGLVAFNDYELTYLSIISVYDALEEELGMNDDDFVWVFTANQTADDEALDTIVKVFDSEEAAQKYLHEFVHGDDGEYAYAKKREWEVPYDGPDYFQAYEKGRYLSNHTEVSIERHQVVGNDINNHGNETQL